MAKSEKKEPEEEILINRVFSGYDINLKLGYEAINLIKADEETNRHYIYAMPNGVYGEEHFKKIKDVLIVRGIDKNRLEVLAKASSLEYVLENQVNEIKKKHENLSNSYKVGNNIHKDDNREDFNKLLNEKQKEYTNGFKYRGVSFKDIYGDYAITEKLHAYVTFIADEYRVPKKGVHIYLVNNEEEANEEKNIYYIKRKRLSSRYLSNFIPNYDLSNKEQTEDVITKNEDYNFEKLKQIINNQNLWGNKQKKELYKPKNETSYLEFMNQIYNETIYSNIIVNILQQHPDLCEDFLKEKLKLKDIKGDIEIKKEVSFKSEDANNEGGGRIDILIKEGKDIFVIENKIKSNINGCEIDENEIIKTQLYKYCAYVNEKYPQEEDYKHHYFIFSPIYNNINKDLLKGTTKNTPKFQYDYQVINYKELHEFFDKQTLLKEDPYYIEFLNDLYIHSVQIDEYHFDLMMRKFSHAIERARQKDN